MQSRKFRVLVAGTNKLFKQQLVGALFQDKVYAYSAIDRQSEFFIFRQSATRKQSVSQVTLQAGQDEWERINNQLPLANDKLVSSYFTYFYSNKKQRQMQALSRAGKEAGTQYRPTETFFLVEANFVLDLEPELMRSLEVIDIPQLYDHKNQSEMYFGSETAATIKPDLIVLAIDEREYFEENVSNIRRALFANPQNPNFGLAQKMWVVKRSSQQPLNRQCIGNLYNELDMFVEWTSKEQFREVLQRQFARLYDLKYRLEEPMEEDEGSALQRNIIDDLPAPAPAVDRLEEPKPLHLTKAQLRELSSSDLQYCLRLLDVDTQHLPLDVYNDHLEKLGYNKRIVNHEISYTREICLFILLALVTVWTQTNILLLFVVLIALAAVERTRQTRQFNRKHFHEEKKRHAMFLFGKDGVVTQRKKEIEAEIDRRRQM